MRARVEARVYGKTRGSEVRLGIVALQVTSHQIEIRRYIAASGRPQAEWARGGACRSGGIDQMRQAKLLHHEVAPRARAVGVFAGIVKGRAFDEPNQQREFTDVELGERLGEVVLAAESEAVYRA